MPATILGENAVTLPADTTANRPASPTPGMHRYNTSTGRPEYYTNATDGWIGYGDTLGTQTNPATNATQLFNSGTTQSGWYYLKGNGSTVYQVYCDMTTAGGKWMLLWQFPKGFTTADVNEFSRSTTPANSTPGALENNSTFTIPISTFSPNGTGTDLDIYSQVYITGAWRRTGAYWRGIHMLDLWPSTNTTFTIAARSIATSGNGLTYTSSTQSLHHSSAWEGITYSTSGGSYSYDDSSLSTGGIIFHDNNNTNQLYGVIDGVAGTGTGGSRTDWTHARVWIRVY